MGQLLGSDSPGNQRDGERVPTTAVVEMGNHFWPRKGITRDVSASGIYIETDSHHRIDSIITFSVELDTPQGRMRLQGCGEVVRIEPRARKVGIAVRITDSTLELIGDAQPGAAAAAPAFAQPQTP